MKLLVCCLGCLIGMCLSLYLFLAYLGGASILSYAIILFVASGLLCGYTDRLEEREEHRRKRSQHQRQNNC